MSEHVTITKGTCYALFAYNIGLSINLTDAERRILAGSERGRLRHKTRAPQYFEYRPAPLRLVQEGSVFSISYYQASPTVEVMVYDFGAVTITYRFPIAGPFKRGTAGSSGRPRHRTASHCRRRGGLHYVLDRVLCTGGGSSVMDKQ